MQGPCVGFVLACCSLLGCAESGSSNPSHGGASSGGGSAGASGWPGLDASAGTGAAGQSGAANGGSAGLAGSDGGATPVFSTIHETHRAIPGKMFGGWGPHLGHLVRAPAASGSGDTLWFVDDVCQPASCDVLHDLALGYFELTPSGWQARATLPLPGNIQQNTGTIVDAAGNVLDTFGIDTSASVVRECRYSPTGGTLGCSALEFKLLPSSNYIGTAISPSGSRMVWWTTVVEGAGTFHYIVDYGGGWNGPRSGFVGGYNDASYINIAFGGVKPSAFTMHAELVSGTAPNWSFLGAVGYGDLATDAAVSWANALAAVGSDAIITTNDIWTDPATGDTHLLAATQAGAVAYFHRPAGGKWSPATFTLAQTFRARFVVSSDRLVLVYGPSAGGLAWRVATAGDRPQGSPVAWANLSESSSELPAGFGPIIAIYPESPAYQTGAAKGINVALVGQTEENVVVHAAIEP